MHPIDAVLAYARREWAVFPCHTWKEKLCSCGRATCESLAKHPRTPRGVNDATTDETLISAQWQRWPDANPAIATGKIGYVDHGLIVVR